MVRSVGRLQLWIGLLGLALSGPTWAQDETDPFLGDDDEIEIDFGIPDKTTEDPKDASDPEASPPPDDTDEVDEPTEEEIDFKDSLDGEGEDLLGDEPEEQVQVGGDTAAIYRMTLEAGKKLDNDEELQLWDAYLEKYPQTAFKQQIDLHRKDLEDQLYSSDHTDPQSTDAEDQDFAFTHGALLENINPRDRLLVLLEWGLPDYASLALDIEKELLPKLSVHAGFRRRFTGLSVEAGARYAILRSPRTKAIVTGILDLRVNTNPAFVALRPMVGFGKRFGNLDLQGQFGVELAPRASFDVRMIGGLNANYHASDAVGLFAETALYMHTLSGAKGPYRFNQFVFGMKFLPAQKLDNPEDVEVSIAATLPYSSAYWQYHYGSVVGQLVLAF